MIEKYELKTDHKKFVKLENAKNLFEKDTGKKIELADFIDMLVDTFISYRNARGPSESSLLENFAKKPKTKNHL